MFKLTKKTAYAVLGLSIVLEQLGTGCLEACESFTRPTFTTLMILCYAGSYFFFSKALRLIDLSISYATWTAVGTVGSVLMGILFFGQSLSPVGWGAIIVMIFGVFLLNLRGTPQDEGDAEKKREVMP